MKLSLKQLRRSSAQRPVVLEWDWLWHLLVRIVQKREPNVRRVRFQGRWQWQVREDDTVHYFDRDRDVVIWLESRYR